MTMDKTAARVIICTCPSLAVSEQLAQGLLHAQLAACINILPNLQSHYRWEGKLEKAEEYLLIIKTVKPFSSIEAFILANHPYSCPEILSLSVEQANAAYLTWLRG